MKSGTEVPDEGEEMVLKKEKEFWSLKSWLRSVQVGRAAPT